MASTEELSADAKSVRLTIGILTLNEADRITQCITSALFAQQIVVLDSGSTDDTVNLAKSLGAEVYIADDWQGFAVQRNRLLQYAKGNYIFFLDADEIIPEELKQEIISASVSDRDAVWEVRWCEVAFGRQLTHMRSTGGVKRMFKRASLKKFSGLVHELPELFDEELPTVRFHSRLLHYSRTSVYDCLRKLAQYVQLGAAKRAAAGKSGGVIRGIASGTAMFLRQYTFGRGFLYGAEGFLFCLFTSLECFFRYAALPYDFKHFDTRSIRL